MRPLQQKKALCTNTKMSTCCAKCLANTSACAVLAAKVPSITAGHACQTDSMVVTCIRSGLSTPDTLVSLIHHQQGSSCNSVACTSLAPAAQHRIAGSKALRRCAAHSNGKACKECAASVAQTAMGAVPHMHLTVKCTTEPPLRGGSPPVLQSHSP